MTEHASFEITLADQSNIIMEETASYTIIDMLSDIGGFFK